MFRRIVTLLACLAAPVGLVAQGPNGAEAGRIVGHVFSTQTGDALASVQVFIVGTGIGTLTSPDGRFVLRNVPNGTHSVQTEMIGYGSKIISDVVVSDGDRAVVDISLDPQAIELEGLTISVEAERGNTAALLGERRRAAAVVDAIGQDQISRSPDGDAGAVLKRVPGVLGSLSQSREYSRQADLIERVFASGGAGDPEVDYSGDFTTASASIGGLLNLSYELAQAHRIRANLIYNRLAEDKFRSLEDNLDSGTDQLNTRIRYVSQTLTNVQLEGTHVLQGLGGSSVKWRTTYTRAERYEPNTREVLYRAFDGTYLFDDFVQSGSVFHQNMVDDGLSGGADMEVPFLRMNYLQPSTFRPPASKSRRRRSVRTTTMPRRPSTRPILMMDAEVLPRLRFVGGVKTERTRQTVTPLDLFPVPGLDPVEGADVSKTQWLPAINFTYEASATTNVRASVSQTLARPQLRELAPFSFADYAGGYLGVPEPHRGTDLPGDRAHPELGQRSRSQQLRGRDRGAHGAGAAVGVARELLLEHQSDAGQLDGRHGW